MDGPLKLEGVCLGVWHGQLLECHQQRDRGIPPLVRVMDVSKHGYGVGEEVVVHVLLRFHRLGGLTTTVSSLAIKRVYEHGGNSPVRGDSCERGFDTLRAEWHMARPSKSTLSATGMELLLDVLISGGGAQHAWRRVTIFSVTMGVHGAHAVVAGVVPICMWRDSSFYAPYTIARWLGWAGRRKVVGNDDEAGHGVAQWGRFGHHGAFGAVSRLERRLGRPVLLQGGLIHCRDLQAVVNALVNQ